MSAERTGEVVPDSEAPHVDDSTIDEPPPCCWTRRFDEPLPSQTKVHVPSRPPLTEVVKLLGIAWRVSKYLKHERKHGREPIFDLSGPTMDPPKPGPYAGVPLGGIGCGCIGRGFRGDFRRWSLAPGRYNHTPLAVDQFSVRVNRKSPTSPPSSPTASSSPDIFSQARPLFCFAT
ncbi:hypothetical protein CYMTET_45604 [Cymbomonas tetramitiformis]|uniref:Glycosyl-hydrolase family 116 N-terminal domain-containing protein n=1 Tax=Cymbomonas tetramitiformis TaxID=36881 RepID=A0AAE0BZN7_9CHLO|nr:hypothetical protein CYMTET_45604 [Cymbomonas tetramitiformis]